MERTSLAGGGGGGWRRRRARRMAVLVFVFFCFYFVAFNELLYGEGETRVKADRVVVGEGGTQSSRLNPEHAFVRCCFLGGVGGACIFRYFFGTLSGCCACFRFQYYVLDRDNQYPFVRRVC